MLYKKSKVQKFPIPRPTCWKRNCAEASAASSNCQAFTLIELLITISIIAILASVGTASFLGFHNRNSLKLAGDQISSLLRTVHDRAISQENQSAWGMYFKNDSSNNNYYYVVFYGNAPPGPPPTGGTTSSITYLDGPLLFLQPSSNNSTTTIFNQLTGNLSNSSPVNIQIALKSDNTASATINVYQNGRVEY